jgi:hypothetical protein
MDPDPEFGLRRLSPLAHFLAISLINIMTVNLIKTRRVSPVLCFLSKVRDKGAVVVGGGRHTSFAAVWGSSAPVVVFAGRRGTGASCPGLLSLCDLSRDWRKKYWRYGKSKRMQASTFCSFSTVRHSATNTVS